MLDSAPIVHFLANTFSVTSLRTLAGAGAYPSSEK